MSREIKFRVWDVERRVMSHPFGFDRITVPFPKRDFWDGLAIDKINERDAEYVLMQFSGLLDSNGVEIYEGDIVTGDAYPFVDEGKPNYRGTVEWIYSQWQVVLRCVNSAKAGISDGINQELNDTGLDEGERFEDLLVIGNIYENPELLEAK